MADLRTLDPRIAYWARYLHWIGSTHDGRLVVTSARRDQTKQARLYERYVRGESLYPVARPGTSRHELGLAFDLARIGVDPYQDPLLYELGRLWTYWGGRYGGAGDPVHFEVRF